MLRVTCPNCENLLSVSENLQGRTCKCGHCNSKLRLPALCPSVSTGTRAVSPGHAPASSDIRNSPTAVHKPPDAKGTIYIVLTTRTSAAQAIRQPLVDCIKRSLRGEQLDYEFVDCSPKPDHWFQQETASPPPPENLGTKDLVLTVSVTEFDYGDQFFRYVFTPISLFGPGAAVLAAQVVIWDRQWARHARACIIFTFGMAAGAD